MLHIIVPTCGGYGSGNDVTGDDFHSRRAFMGFYGSLHEHCLPAVIYLIGNAPDDLSEKVVLWGRKFLVEPGKKPGQDVRLYWERRQIGYVGACNIGYRLADPADEDLVVVLNDDLVFEGEWLNPLVAAIRGGAAQAGPSLKWVGRDGFWGKGDEKYQFLEGWCFMTTGLAIRKAHHQRGRDECWEDRHVGTTQLFDSAFAPGYCEDSDFSIRVQESGGTLKQVDLPIRHLGSMTLGKNHASWARQRALLISKWDLG